MKPKNILTIGLLLFVAASLAALVVNRLRHGVPDEFAPEGITVCYFHGNKRCPSCRSIEACTKEAMATGFAEQLKDERLYFQIVNFDRPANEQFKKECSAQPIVVLLEMRGGKQTRRKDIPEVWEFVGDKPALVAFVREQVEAFLEESNRQPKQAG